MNLIMTRPSSAAVGLDTTNGWEFKKVAQSHSHGTTGSMYEA